MFWLDTKRVIKSGFLNFLRNGVISLSSVLVFTITLSVVILLIFLQATLHSSLSQIKDKVDVTIYFTTDAPEMNIFEFKQALEKLPEVDLISYVSSEEALANFQARHIDDQSTLQALDELDENPLGAALNIKAKETSQYENIAKFIEEDNVITSSYSNIIDEVNYYKNKIIIDRLTSIIDGARQLGFILTLIFVFISITLVFNTIRLTIYINREEIGIMRLVGAGDKHIRGPFMVEGIIYGVVSSVIAMMLFYPITVWLGRNMDIFLGINLFDYYLSNFIQIFVIVLLVGVLLGVIASFLAVRKYLNR